ncbi:MAG: Glu/Leu/Phe/Val dehydrogenase dimerization domain-containing protein [Bacteroidia bacterium]|nr:Glu/Leu/Phe/Val dehydrogenase dimerization domain-containing protein [Bacteroidia bacterium]
MAPAATASPFERIAQMGHENVVYCHDPETGLRAIIAIHNTVLGPSLGGLRFWHYAHEAEALEDVLRLSRGMTFKSSLAGIHLGGGKAVILGDASQLKTEALLRRFGKFVDNLGGKYYTAEDVNISVRDIETIRQETRYVAGLPEELGGSGDPSPVTAYGVYLGIRACLKYQTGSESPAGKRVVVQGVGKVGSYLVEHLVKDGAQVFVHDIHPEAVAAVVNAHGVTPIAEADVVAFDCDVYAPCALGGGLSPHTIPKLKCGIVCGGANNQLLEEQRDGEALKARGILYGPDFLVNAGGVINVYTELEGYNQKRALRKAEQIYDTCLKVLHEATDTDTTTHAAALQLALRRIDSIAGIQKFL